MVDSFRLLQQMNYIFTHRLTKHQPNLSFRGEHGGEGEHNGHGHGEPLGDRLRRHKEGEPADRQVDGRRDVRLDHVVASVEKIFRYSQGSS